MDSDNEEQDRRDFAKAGGDAMNLDDDDDGGFPGGDSEDVDDDGEEDMIEEAKKASASKAAGPKTDVKGDKLDN